METIGALARTLILVGALALAPGSIVVFADVKSRKGYGLVLLVLVIAALDILGFVTNYHPGDPSFYSSHSFAGVWVAVTVLSQLGLFFLIGLAGLLVAALSRQWGWFLGGIATLLPMLLLALTGGLPNSPASYQQQSALFYLALVCPLAFCLAYGIVRITSPRSSQPPSLEQR